MRCLRRESFCIVSLSGELFQSERKGKEIVFARQEYSLRCEKKAVIGSELLGVLVSAKSKHDSDKVHYKVFGKTKDMVTRFNCPDIYYIRTGRQEGGSAGRQTAFSRAIKCRPMKRTKSL